MSVLNFYFNSNVVQNTPVTDDYLLVHKTGKDGEDITELEKVDYVKLQRSLGPASNWSITALMRAGIDPKSLTPHTSSPTRSEGYDEVDKLISDLQTQNNTK